MNIKARNWISFLLFSSSRFSFELNKLLVLWIFFFLHSLEKSWIPVSRNSISNIYNILIIILSDCCDFGDAPFIFRPSSASEEIYGVCVHYVAINKSDASFWKWLLYCSSYFYYIMIIRQRRIIANSSHEEVSRWQCALKRLMLLRFSKYQKVIYSGTEEKINFAFNIKIVSNFQFHCFGIGGIPRSQQ